MAHGPRMESWLAVGLTCTTSWLTNEVQLCCATTSHLCLPLYPSCRNHRIHSIFTARKEYYSDGVGGDAISLMFVDLWLECAIQQLRNISIHAALLRSAHIPARVSWTKVARSLDICHCSYVVELWCLEHFMMSDDSSIYTGLMVQINLIFRSYSV